MGNIRGGENVSVSAPFLLTTTMSLFPSDNRHNNSLNGLLRIIESMEAVEIANEGFRLKQAGALDEAEERMMRALAAKQTFLGPDTVSAAITHDNLGRVQLQMGKLDEAEANFRKALENRKDVRGEEWDNAVTRENLAQVLEAKGDLKGAKEVRLSCGPASLCCANYEVSCFSHLRYAGGYQHQHVVPHQI